MTTLVKPLLYEITAQGTAGTPGTPYIPAQPPRVVEELVKVVHFYPVTHDPSLTPGDPGGAYITYEVVYTTIPGSAAIPATPGTPPTPAVVATLYDRQWNSAADSIDLVPPGSYIECQVRYGSYAVFIGLDADARNSTLPSAYRYGLMVDASGIRPFENGVSGALLAANTPTTTLRIIRSELGQIYYQVVGQSLVASPQAPVPDMAPMQGYGLLYSSLDAVDGATIGTLDIVEGTVPFPMAASLSVAADPRVVFDVAVGFVAAPGAPAVVFPVAVSFEATPSRVILGDVTFPATLTFAADAYAGGRGTWTLPTLAWTGADYDTPGAGAWRLPAFTANGTEQVYVPADPDEGLWILPRMAVWGIGLDEDHGGGTWPLPAVAAIGTEEGVIYGQGNWTLPVHLTLRSYPPWWREDTLMLVSPMYSAETLQLQLDLVLILNSSGTLTSTLSLTRLQVLALLSALAATTSLTLSGIYSLSLLSAGALRSLQSLQAELGAELPDGAAVWVLNLDTSASAQYDNYGFNSFFRRGDDYFGVANDGIYKLAGETDAGLPVDALAAFVRSTLGVPNVKRVPSVYVGATSDGALILRTEVEGAVRYYKARSYSSDLRQHRVDIGRGSRGTHWQFELLNENGDDFELADMTLLPTVMDRRI